MPDLSEPTPSAHTGSLIRASKWVRRLLSVDAQVAETCRLVPNGLSKRQQVGFLLIDEELVGTHRASAAKAPE